MIRELEASDMTDQLQDSKSNCRLSVEATLEIALESAIRAGQPGLINYHMRLLMEAGACAACAGDSESEKTHR